MQACNGVGTPGVRDAPADEDQKLDAAESTKMRRIIATMNYITQDRPDLGYAVKECARGMANPTERTVRLTKRVGRDLKLHPRMATIFKWQDELAGFTTYTDSDWAGCVVARRSISGGIIKRGEHIIKHWSRTQSVVALSPGEAELCAVVKGSTETIGTIQLACEMGQVQTGTLCTDSSAAKGTVSRIGGGKLKHVAVNDLWVQEKCASGALIYRKVPRTANPSDNLTHDWEGNAAERFFASCGLSRTSQSGSIYRQNK